MFPQRLNVLVDGGVLCPGGLADLLKTLEERGQIFAAFRASDEPTQLQQRRLQFFLDEVGQILALITEG